MLQLKDISIKAILGCVLLTVFSVQAGAQLNLGITTSNWCSTSGMFINPANIAAGRERKIVSLLSLTTGVDNNVGPFNTKGGLVVAVGNGKTNNMFQYTKNTRVSMLAPYMEITGPGVMWRLDSAHSIAISTRLRGMNQFNNFDQTLFHTFNDPAFRTKEDILASPKDFTYTVHLWSEIGFTYAGVFFDDGHHKIKAGGTLRYLTGIAYVGVKGRNMDVKFTTGNDTFYSANTDIEYASNILNTRSSQGDDIAKSLFSLLYRGKFGHGFGGDLGVVYEYTPLGRKPKDGYAARFSASVCDMGVITYSSGINANERFSGAGKVTGVGILDNVKNFDDLRKYAVKRGFNADIRQMTSKVYMPVHMILAGDYNIHKHYYANLTLLLNLADRERFGNSYYNQFTITPRYETKAITVGMPITYSTLSNRFKAGIGLLSGGVYIGSDDMLSMLFKTEYGLNLYAGLNVPIYK